MVLRQTARLFWFVCFGKCPCLLASVVPDGGAAESGGESRLAAIRRKAATGSPYRARKRLPIALLRSCIGIADKPARAAISLTVRCRERATRLTVCQHCRCTPPECNRAAPAIPGIFIRAPTGCRVSSAAPSEPAAQPPRRHNERHTTQDPAPRQYGSIQTATAASRTADRPTARFGRPH